MSGAGSKCATRAVISKQCFEDHALHDVDRGVYLRYRLDGSLFDLRRLNAKTKMLERLIPD